MTVVTAYEVASMSMFVVIGLLLFDTSLTVFHILMTYRIGKSLQKMTGKR